MAAGLACRVLLVVVGCVACVAAYLRGNELLGPVVGGLYAVTAALLLLLAHRSRTAAGRVSPLRLVWVAVLAVPLGVALAFPTALNPDVQVFIDKTATERAARRELAALFASDPAFLGLSVSAIHLKVVNLIIKGSLASEEALRRLRSRVFAECPTAAGCVIHWELTFRDTGRRIDGTDRELFRD